MLGFYFAGFISGLGFGCALSVLLFALIVRD